MGRGRRVQDERKPPDPPPAHRHLERELLHIPLQRHTAEGGTIYRPVEYLRPVGRRGRSALDAQREGRGQGDRDRAEDMVRDGSAHRRQVEHPATGDRRIPVRGACGRQRRSFRNRNLDGAEEPSCRSRIRVEPDHHARHGGAVAMPAICRPSSARPSPPRLWRLPSWHAVGPDGTRPSRARRRTRGLRGVPFYTSEKTCPKSAPILRTHDPGHEVRNHIRPRGWRRPEPRRCSPRPPHGTCSGAARRGPAPHDGRPCWRRRGSRP